VCFTRVAALQETLAGFQVRCCALQRLHEARRGVHSRVQAAAAARVVGRPNILKSVEIGDGVSVVCHLIADADAVNKPDYSCQHYRTEQKDTPLLLSAEKGHLEICRLLLQCNANVEAKDRK
jgi:hypothetical protein